jgi:hypothetical protein
VAMAVLCGVMGWFADEESTRQLVKGL